MGETSSSAPPVSASAPDISRSSKGLTDESPDDHRAQLDRLLSKPFFRNTPARNLPTFDASEIGTGPQLGVGGFGVVSEVEYIKLMREGDKGDEDVVGDAETNNQDGQDNNATAQSDRESTGDNAILAETNLGMYLADVNSVRHDDDDHHHHHLSGLTNPDEARAFMAKHALRDGNARYAIKRLKPDLSEKDKEAAVMDLAIEAKFLAVISHPNIVKMRGVASTDSLRYDYFIVMDRLRDTLDERIGDWAEQEKKLGGSCCGFWGADKGQLKEIRLERMTALYDISKAMGYLHENDIIYRDTKPENCGFDVRGDVKVFDFGISRVLQKKDSLEDGTYKLTSCCGSLRYMAPEVALSKPYNLTADVFSFATLAWQVLELKTPFESLSAMRYIEVVCREGWRPPLSTKWPARLRRVLQDSWNANLAERPNFTRISRVLRGEMTAMADSDHGSIHERTQHMMDRSNRSQNSRIIRRMRSNSKGIENSLE